MSVSMLGCIVVRAVLRVLHFGLCTVCLRLVPDEKMLWNAVPLVQSGCAVHGAPSWASQAIWWGARAHSHAKAQATEAVDCGPAMNFLLSIMSTQPRMGSHQLEGVWTGPRATRARVCSGSATSSE